MRPVFCLPGGTGGGAVIAGAWGTLEAVWRWGGYSVVVFQLDPVLNQHGRRNHRSTRTIRYDHLSRTKWILAEHHKLAWLASSSSFEFGVLIS